MRITSYVCLVWLIIGCSQNNQDLTLTNPKILDALEKRKLAYKKDIMDNCQRDVYERAKLYVDSLIAAEINFQLSDSIVFPPKPIKPPSPGPIIVPDTIKAKPVF
jgi:hypothetical protein